MDPRAAATVTSVAARTRSPGIALNPDRLGHAYPPVTYEVSREKLREYARATGVVDPALEADAAEVPLASLTAPPTFAATFTVGLLDRVIGDPELGAHWNLVHSSQRFRFTRAVRGGDVLRCTPRITEVTSRRALERLTVEVAAHEAGSGEPVLVAETTLVLREDATSQAPGEASSEAGGQG